MPADLRDAFVELGALIGHSPFVLMDYANEDTYGGYHPDPVLSMWPTGSVFEVEGKILYALVRALRPRLVLEIGVYYAASTTHILAALKANHDEGQLLSLDHAGVQGDGPPECLRDHWTFIQADANDWIPEFRSEVDIVFEDGYHEYNFVHRAIQTVCVHLRPRVIISHDAMHPELGPFVRRAWDELLPGYRTMLVPPSDCGFAYWIRPEK